MTYPETDRLAEAVLAGWRDGRPAQGEEQLVTFPRPWQPAAGDGRARVAYRWDGSREAPTLHASCDGLEVALDAPLRLEPVTIPKPWGREVWFSGLEARGESRVCCPAGTLSLGTYLALAPQRIAGGRAPLLLKRLEPAPEPVVGELYLEVHATKREVYVVSDVNPRVWPDGVGRMRFGVNQALRRRLGDDAFRRAFLDAVGRYEALRRALDAGQPVAEEEQAAREATLEYTDSIPLSVGDVVSVPSWMPHSLQPGVQVVEFQTPDYERYIISSSQKVLTQDGWDSAFAIERMSLEAPALPSPEPVAPGVERIARFEDFSVWRAALDDREALRLPTHVPYAIGYCIAGTAELSGPGAVLTLPAGTAAFIPAAAIGQPIRGGTVLLAAPGL
jgi:hypothetical protein